MDSTDTSLLGLVNEPDEQSLLQALFHLSAEIMAELDPMRLVQRIVAAVVTTVPQVDGAALWVYNRAADRLEQAALYGVHHAPGVPAEPWIVKVRPTDGWVGQAFSSGIAVTVTDRATREQYLAQLPAPGRNVIQRYLTRWSQDAALLAVPLSIGSLPVGVIVLINEQGIVPLSGGKLTIFQTFANQIGVVLRNVQLYEQLQLQNRRWQAFDAVVTTISGSDDLAQSLEQALDVVLQVVQVPCGAIALVDQGTTTISPAVWRNCDAYIVDRLGAIPIDDSPYAEIVADSRAVVQPLGPDHPWFEIFGHAAEAIALSPLLAGGTVVGVLLLAGPLAPLQLLNRPSLIAMGAQIGFAVANARLFAATNSERRRLAGVIASIAEGVIICDAHGAIVMANDAAGSILGARVEIGLSLEALTDQFHFRDVTGNSLSGQCTPFGRALEREVFQDGEVVVRTGDGHERILNTSGAPLLADGGSLDGAVVVFRDVTAHKQHDAARDEFLAIAAHELRSPLAAIKGYTDLLVKRELGRTDVTERDMRGIVMLSRQVDHLVLLIDNLLDVSRLDAGRLQLALQMTDIMALVEASVERVRAGDGRHDFVVNGPPRVMVVADQLRVQQVLTNLLANAVRYSPAATQIRVDVAEQATVFDDDRRPVPAVVITVADDGPGIPEAVQERIFERYFRAATTTSSSGLGLGLYLCREIVALHGGRISVTSPLGGGATFTVELPINGPGA